MIFIIQMTPKQVQTKIYLMFIITTYTHSQKRISVLQGHE